MIARAVLASWLVLLSSIESAAEGKDVSASEIDRWIPGILSASSVPGLSLAVVRNGEIAFAAGYGVKDEKSAPVAPETIFEAASLSKPVFAYGALLLTREGKLDLDAPLTSYLETAFIEDDPRLERITARLVLSHSTGLPNWRPGRWTDSPGPLRIEFEPGSRFGYSGEGYEYLGLAIERITGVSIEDFLQRAVLKPLGMLDSSYVWQVSYEESSAKGHDRSGKPVSKLRPKRANVAASLHTSARDYARFLLAMVDSTRTDVVSSMMKEETKIDAAL
ncbi:MAG TPA: serine hydrolase domain-containing protein, partial [Vicinamibacteria bacterium]|nr:serine hydrolase domain-containing protein [Vicinamibacteria bacterium]